jgi:cyclin B
MNSSRLNIENVPHHSSKPLTPTPRAPLRIVSSADSVEDSKHPESCYAEEITGNLRGEETKFMAAADYMNKQQDINYKMRAVLVDWLVSVHLKFLMTAESLYLAVNLVDRYLEKKVILRAQLQLVGVTALFVASKYEEIYPRELKEFVNITDRAYTKEQLIRMELDMLRVLQFTITVPSALRFLERFSLQADSTETTTALAKYLLELPLVEYHMVKYSPSLQAASALFLARKILKVEPGWTSRLAVRTDYYENQMKPCAKDMLILFQAAPRHSLGAVRDKYSRRDYLEVSKIRIPQA